MRNAKLWALPLPCSACKNRAYFFLRTWRNWQTRWFQVPVKRFVQVQVLSFAPKTSGYSAAVAHLSGGQGVMSSNLVTPTNKKGTFVYQKFLFLFIAKAIAYHHASACISSALTSISRQSEYIISRRLYPLSQ